MAAGVIAVDQHLKVIVYNGAALNVLDMNSSIIGKPLASVLKLLDKNQQPVDIAAYVRAVKTPRADRDLRLRYSDGSFANIFMSIAPVYEGYGSGGQSGYVLVLRDITREKSLEEERDEFIGVVSHELRTPIAIAEGNVSNAQLIAEKSGDMAEVKQALASAHEQIVFLSAMMNDLATLSRAERGKLSVELEAIDVPKLVTTIIANYKPEANAKKLKLSSDIDAKLAELHSSKLYVREILQNFMTNALKYTSKGNIVVSAKTAKGGVLFAVTDTGIGVSKSDQAKLFTKFFRSEDWRTRSTSGTGLGLYVAKKLASLIHAEITIESELNHGSTFSVFVPDLS